MAKFSLTTCPILTSIPFESMFEKFFSFNETWQFLSLGYEREMAMADLLNYEDYTRTLLPFRLRCHSDPPFPLNVVVKEEHEEPQYGNRDVYEACPNIEELSQNLRILQFPLPETPSPTPSDDTCFVNPTPEIEAAQLPLGTPSLLPYGSSSFDVDDFSYVDLLENGPRDAAAFPTPTMEGLQAALSPRDFLDPSFYTWRPMELPLSPSVPEFDHGYYNEIPDELIDPVLLPPRPPAPPSAIPDSEPAPEPAMVNSTLSGRPWRSCRSRPRNGSGNADAAGVQSRLVSRRQRRATRQRDRAVNTRRNTGRNRNTGGEGEYLEWSGVVDGVPMEIRIWLNDAFRMV